MGKLTDRQHKKMIARYAECQNYSQVAREFHVSVTTVKRHVLGDEKALKIVNEKKEQNTADVLAYMESKKDLVCEIIGLGLKALAEPEKFAEAAPQQITTALGTLIDKWTANSAHGANDVEDLTPLADMLKLDNNE